MISMQTENIRTWKVRVIYAHFQNIHSLSPFHPSPRSRLHQKMKMSCVEKINGLLNEIREPENGAHVLSVDFQEWLYLWDLFNARCWIAMFFFNFLFRANLLVLEGELLMFCFWDRVVCSSDWHGTGNIAVNGFEYLLLPMWCSGYYILLHAC